MVSMQKWFLHEQDCSDMPCMHAVSQSPCSYADLIRKDAAKHRGRGRKSFLADAACEGVVVKYAAVQSRNLAPQRVQS